MIRAGELTRDRGRTAGADAGTTDGIWFAPVSSNCSQRELATAYARSAGRSGPHVSPIPIWLLRAVGLAHRGTRELVEMGHLFTRPLVVDASASDAKLELEPTPFDDAVRATVDAYLAGAR
ncbi:hypothetical protein GCM10025864_15570 [Luteimicrobium album]|uniref:Uncharacterized protein n=1 Tax=Luteimicrobium album TaxID=1054550 RepID=A0ABQ6I1I5_9MICO|nr:hypothetical protein [Luteimicrobium album]GMA23798.1 hypothetical protein GCM10025864_15570 [Luteimicrobium album]